MKNIIIFGATGGTGQELVKQALTQKYRVTAFVRDPDKIKITDSNLLIFQGDVLNPENTEKAMENQEAVFCCLGAHGMDRSFIRTKGTSNIIQSMENAGVQRLICLSSLGVGDSAVALPWLMRTIIIPLFIKYGFKDHEEQEKIVRRSGLDWSIVRPAYLTNGAATGMYKTGFSTEEKIAGKISRADVADFMLKLINENPHIHQQVGLSY
jgi:putative NADH-flavin reductase